MENLLQPDYISVQTLTLQVFKHALIQFLYPVPKLVLFENALVYFTCDIMNNIKCRNINPLISNFYNQSFGKNKINCIPIIYLRKIPKTLEIFGPNANI